MKRWTCTINGSTKPQIIGCIEDASYNFLYDCWFGEMIPFEIAIRLGSEDGDFLGWSDPPLFQMPEDFLTPCV